MNNLIKGEFFKFRKSRGVRIAMLLTIVSAIFLFMYINLFCTNKLGEVNSFTGASVLYNIMSGVVWLNFFFSILAAVFVANDFEKETINMTFTYNYSRFDVLISKFIVYSLGIILLKIIFISVNTIMFTLVNGFGETINFILIISYLKWFLISLLCSISTASIIFLIAILSKNTIITVISPIAILIIYMITSAIDNNIISNILPFNLLIEAIGKYSTIRSSLFSITHSGLIIMISILLCNLHLKTKEFK
ncbi:MAG: ABC transporter permease [Sarcina sp.]